MLSQPIASPVVPGGCLKLLHRLRCCGAAVAPVGPLQRAQAVVQLGAVLRHGLSAPRVPPAQPLQSKRPRVVTGGDFVRPWGERAAAEGFMQGFGGFSRALRPQWLCRLLPPGLGLRVNHAGSGRVVQGPGEN